MIRIASKPLRLLACTAVVAALLAGCGGGSSDVQQIKQLYPAFLSAMRQGKWSEVCSYMSSERQSAMVARLRSDGVNAGSCAQAMAKVSAANPSFLRNLGLATAGASLKVDSVSIHGNRATARVTGNLNGQSGAGTGYFVREGGRWRMSSTPGG